MSSLDVLQTGLHAANSFEDVTMKCQVNKGLKPNVNGTQWPSRGLAVDQAVHAAMVQRHHHPLALLHHPRACTRARDAQQLKQPKRRCACLRELARRTLRVAAQHRLRTRSLQRRSSVRVLLRRQHAAGNELVEAGGLARGGELVVFTAGLAVACPIAMRLRVVCRVADVRGLIVPHVAIFGRNWLRVRCFISGSSSRCRLLGWRHRCSSSCTRCFSWRHRWWHSNNAARNIHLRRLVLTGGWSGCSGGLGGRDQWRRNQQATG